MDLNIPKTATVSHELPIFKELSHDSGLPLSEVKARFRNEMLEKHEEIMDDPSKMVLGGTTQDLVHDAVNSLRDKLSHPEEQTEEKDEFDDIMGFDPNEPAPGADAFGMDDGGFGGGFGGGDFGGGFGGGGFGGGAGGAGGGIDNLDLGFSDEGMASLDSVSDEMSDFGSEATGDEVNAMSEIEPGTPDDGTGDLGSENTEEAGSEEPTSTDDFADLF